MLKSLIQSSVSVFALGLPVLAFGVDVGRLQTDFGKSLELEYRVSRDGRSDIVFPPSVAVNEIRACGVGAEQISGVQLWMPDHGHGSVPTRVSDTDDAPCVMVENVLFVMPGRWELRFEFSDGDRGVAVASVEGSGHRH